MSHAGDRSCMLWPRITITLSMFVVTAPSSSPSACLKCEAISPVVVVVVVSSSLLKEMSPSWKSSGPFLGYVGRSGHFLSIRLLKSVDISMCPSGDEPVAPVTIFSGWNVVSFSCNGLMLGAATATESII